MGTKEVCKLIFPPILIETCRWLRARYLPNSQGLYLSGDYASWDAARKASMGYDAEIILERTKTALLRVKNGEALYERDSVLLDQAAHSWPLLAALMWVAAQSGGTLNVLDFGGSLGSTYFQNRSFLDPLENVRWTIVEQPRHVKEGREHFQDNRLKFCESIQEASCETQPNVIILSGVLQCVERPYEVLDELMRLNSACIIIDRTPFWDGVEDRLCIEHHPPSIYPASYPCWIFSRSKFVSRFSNGRFMAIANFLSIDDMPAPVDLAWEGMLLVQSTTCENFSSGKDQPCDTG